MKFLSPQNASSVISILFHACLFFIILFYFNQKSDYVKKNYIEIGFGGTMENNSPGMPGSSSEQTYNPPPVKEKIKIKKETEKKTVVKKDVINNRAKKEKQKKTVKIDSTKIASSGTTSSGINNTEGTGTGNSGNGQSGSAPAKKGINVNNNVYYVAVDQMPVPIGGMESINAKVVCNSSRHGTVYVQAFIDEHGTVRRVSLIKGLGGPCDEAALRAVRETTFEAGRLRGIPVKVQMTIAVSIGNNNQ